MKIRRILAAVLTAAVIVGSIPVSELSVFAQEIGQVETGTEIEAEVETNTEIEAEVETNKEVKIGTEDDAGVDVFSIEEDGIEDSDVTDKNVAVETEEVIENESDSNYNLLVDSQFDASLKLTENSDYESAHFVAYYRGKLIASEDVKKGEYFRYKSGSYIAITGLGSQSEGNTGTLDTNYVCVSINENGGSEYPNKLYGSGYCWDDNQDLFSLGERNIESVQIEAAQLKTSKIACVSDMPECNITYSVADKVGDYVKIDNSKEGQVRVNIGIPEGYEFTSGTFDATFGGTDNEGYQLCSHAKLFVDNNTNEYYCVLDFQSLARLAHIVDDWPNDKFNINATVAQKEEEGVHSNYTVNCSDEYGDKHYKLLPAQFGSNIVKDSNDNNYYIVDPKKPIKVVLIPEQYYDRKDAPYVFVGNDRVDVDWDSYWYRGAWDQLNSEFTINNMDYEDGGYIIIPFDGNVRITDGNEDGSILTIVEPVSSDYSFSADNETLGKYGNWSYCVESTTFYDGAGNQVLTPSFELLQNGDHGKLSDVTLGSTVKFKIKMKPGMVLNSVTRVWYEDKEGKRYGDSDYKRYHGDVLKADENGIYSFEANASYTWIYINAEPEGNYCDDGKVKLTIEPSGFTKVTMTEVIGTRKCTLKLHRRGTHYDLGEWTYNFKNSDPGNVMWIFVDPDKKSWYSKWTYQGIVEYSGTYYVTLETEGKVYRSADFVYTKPENKLDAPKLESFYVEEQNESGWGRYLHWDDINNDKCAGYEFEAKSAENGKSSNFMMFYPNDKSGYCLDNMYNALGTGKWTIRIRAISNDINEVTVGDWTEYEYTMTKRVPATSVTLSDTSMSLYMEGDDSSAVITAVVDPAKTVTLTGVSWKSSNEKVAKIEQIGNNMVKVTAVGVGTAKIVATTFDSANKSATCNVTVRQSRPVVSFTGINSGIRLYTPGVNNALGQLGEVLSADENDNVCLNSDYGETIYFVPIPTDDNHEIDTVKVGTKALSAVKGKYEDNDVTKDITYYKLSNITRSQTVNITQKARAMTTDDYFELDQSNAQNRKFATSVATAGENGKYYFKKDTRNLTFTVTYDIAHAPVVSIGHHDEGGFVPEETLHGTLETDAKYTKRIYTYKIEAFKASGKVIQITDQDAPKKQLRVEVQPAAVLEPVVKIGADTKTFEEEESEPGAGIYVYSIPEFSTVAVSYAFKEGKSDSYRLTGITVNGKAQATAVVNKGTVSTVVADDSDVHFKATGITTMFLTKDGDTEIIFNNGVAKLGSRDTATLQIRNGDSTEEPLALSSNSEIACVVKAGGKDVPGFATVSDDKKTVTIDAKTAAILNKNPVTVTLQGDDFAKQTIKFNVDQLVSGITAKKFDKSTQQNKATQNAGTVATYALTFAPKGAPLDNICIKYVNGSDENGQVFLATESNGSMVLSVETFKDNEIATKPLMVQFYDNAGNDDPSDDIEIGLPFVITPSAKFAAPTVKLLSATDIGMKLSLKAPKGLEQYKNLYYEISATPKSPISDKMIAEGLVVHEPINAMETELILAKVTENSNSPILGDGAAQKYDVTVKIVQVIQNNDNIGDVIFNSNNIFTPKAGAIKKITASTKAPYYETNLTLKGKKATFTQGETTPGFERSGLYVAMAKFSSATTFASVDPEKSYVAGADGKKIDGADILVGPDGVSIWISNTSVIPVGKATLVVAPLAPEGAQYKNATLALKVKAPIDKISLTQKGAMSSGNGIKLFKKQDTAATIKFTATPLWDGDDSNSDSWFNPASKKVEWTLTAPSGSALLNNKNATINTSNGTVTISKGYICNNPDLDKFTVTAKAADFTGNIVSASMEVTLTSEAIELVTAKVVNDQDEEVNVSSASSKDLIGKTLKFYDKNGNWIDPINLVYNVKPAGIGFDSKGKIVSVSKAGKFTVTATSLDGGKSSLATTITNAGLTIGSAKVFVWDNAEGKYKEVTDYDTVDSSTFGYISFYDEEGNAIKCSDLDIKASTGLTLTINSPDSDKAFITAVKQSGTYKVTATTKDGGEKKLVKDITFTGTTEGYEVTKLTYSSGSNNTNVFETIPKLLDNPSVQEATVSNANAICLDVFRTDSGVYPYNAKVTVSGGSIITKTVGTIWDDDGKVRQGGKYVIKPTKDVVDIIVNGGGKKAVYKINVISGKRKALKASKLTKTEFIGATTASYDTSFTFETSEFKADATEEYRLVFTPNEAYHKVKTDKERSAYDTLAALLKEAGNKVDTTSITPTSGAVFKTTLTNYGSVPVGSYKFDVTAVKVIRDDKDKIIELEPLTKPLTVTFKAKAPKAISAKLNNSGKVTIDDTESDSAQIPFVSNSAYSSIINTEKDKPILYNNNDKGVISSFKKYFDVTVSDDKLILKRKSGEDAKYNWTEAEKKKGNTAIVGWVEYTVVGQDGITKRTYCEKVTATLKYNGN